MGHSRCGCRSIPRILRLTVNFASNERWRRSCIEAVIVPTQSFSASQPSDRSLDHLREALRASHVNLLIIGPDDESVPLFNSLLPYLRTPLREWSGTLPSAQPGTLVLRDVSALPSADQAMLIDWLNEQGTSVQVVSLDRQPVFPLVEQGVFLSTLYYRLNIVSVMAEDIKTV
jgi:hypothetical protein